MSVGCWNCVTSHEVRWKTSLIMAASNKEMLRYTAPPLRGVVSHFPSHKTKWIWRRFNNFTNLWSNVRCRCYNRETFCCVQNNSSRKNQSSRKWRYVTVKPLYSSCKRYCVTMFKAGDKEFLNDFVASTNREDWRMSPRDWWRTSNTRGSWH